MSKKISINLFKFDAKMDYLAYYKQYGVKYDEEDTVLDLLVKIDAIETFSFEKSDDFNLKINGLFLNAGVLLKDIIDATSSELTIEPISTLRATDDLIINKDDYIHKMEHFSDIVEKSVLDDYIKSFELDYYASNTYNFNNDYIGDSSLLLISDIITNHPSKIETMIKYISSKEDGIWFHTSLEHRVFNYESSKEQKIQNLLSMLPQTQQLQKEDKATQTSTQNISQYFDGFNIASYEGVGKNSCTTLIDDAKASSVELSLKYEDLAPQSKIADKNFSLKIAGDILLQAKDNNADFLIVRNSDDITLFDAQQKAIEKIMGREIDLPVISQEQFGKVLSGEKNKTALGFDNHIVNVSFL